MSLVVLDTNILVSSLWSKDGIPSKIVKMVLDKKLVICHDFRIMNEYKIVLNRPKFSFNPNDIHDLLDFFQKHGVSIIADQQEPTLRVEQAKLIFTDESDRKFYDVARTLVNQELNATLITGNLKHYPKKPFILSATEFFVTFAEVSGGI